MAVDYAECRTPRERVLWLRLQQAQDRIAALESTGGISPTRRGPPRSPLSKDELRLHRRRCAARARLGRPNLSAAARRRVLAQARALGAIPDDFDEDAYLDDFGAEDCDKEAGPNGIDPAGIGHSGPHRRPLPDDLIVLHPESAMRWLSDPQLFFFWCGTRLAKIDESLGPADVAQMETFLHHLPYYRALDNARPRSPKPILYYPDNATIARGPRLELRYPNGDPIIGDRGQVFYPGGGLAHCIQTNTTLYPDGRYLADPFGRWHSPSHEAGTLDDLAGQIKRASGARWPRVDAGFRRVPGDVAPIAILELAWSLLRAR